jgi:anti-sigma regulatory factor (Ser/Thr protein kinase)
MTATRQATERASGRAAPTATRERGAASASLALKAVPTAPREARRFATQALRRWRTPPDIIGSAQTIVSELVTNAYRATSPDAGQPGVAGSGTAGRISLTLWRLPRQIVIGVTDHDKNPPLRSDASADAESGRGLTLVQALSDQWGHRPLPAGGKVVYAILGVPQ